MRKIMITISFFTVLLGCTNPKKLSGTKKATLDTTLMYVQMSVNPEIYTDTVKIPGDIIKRGEGFIMIDEGLITVVGIAKWTKGGAFIEVDSLSYFIENLDTWPTHVYHKKVRASGRCITYDGRVLMRWYPYRQGARVKKTLKKVKWEVVE